MLRKKLFNLFLTIATALILFFSSNINVHADELAFAVAPSKIVNLVIEPGSSQVLTFKVGNRSVFPSHQVEKNELYNFEIKVEGKMFDSEGTEISNKDIIKVGEPILRCKPNEAVSVDVKIDIPKDFEKNSYEASIVFTRMPIEGVEDTTNTNAITSIKVPIYLGVGNPEEYSRLKTNFEVEKFNLNLGEEKTIASYVIDNLKQLITLNPFKVVDVFKSISEKELYAIKNRDITTIDTISDIFTDLENVITDDEKKISKNKYVLASKEDYSKAVKNIYFEDKVVKFQLDKNKTIVIKCENGVRDNIRTQINNLIKEHSLKSPSFAFFVENLRVPKNVDYDVPRYDIEMTLKNTGEKETFVTSGMILKKDSTTEVGNAKLELITLKKGNLVDVKIPLELNSELSNGTYNLYGNFIDIKNVQKTANFKFNVDLNLDKTIFTITLIVYLVAVVIIIALIIVLIYILKSRKGIIGFVAKNSIQYSPIDREVYINTFNLENDEELDRYKVVESVESIVRTKPDLNKSKIVTTLQQGDIIEIIEDSIVVNDVPWIKIKVNKNKTNK